MINDRYPHKPHFILKNTGTAEPFQLRGGFGSKETPARDRRQHGGLLRQQLAALRPEIEQAPSVRLPVASTELESRGANRSNP